MIFSIWNNDTSSTIILIVLIILVVVVVVDDVDDDDDDDDDDDVVGVVLPLFLYVILLTKISFSFTINVSLLTFSILKVTLLIQLQCTLQITINSIIYDKEDVKVKELKCFELLIQFVVVVVMVRSCAGLTVVTNLVFQ